MDPLIIKQVVPRLGRILKTYREKTGRNQGDVASKAGISVSMLSQIERGMVAPSIETLMMVCSVLDLDAGHLFRLVAADEHPVRILHSGERLRNEVGGVRYEQLMTSTQGSWQSEMFLLEVASGCSTTFSGGGHEGVEMGYVLDGEAVLTVDANEYAVCRGDSIHFSSHLPHQLRTSGKKVFRAIWSISPPHVDYLGSSEE
jgi:transcriptional regulator with XRE-family HTH domain